VGLTGIQHDYIDKHRVHPAADRKGLPVPVVHKAADGVAFALVNVPPLEELLDGDPFIFLAMGLDQVADADKQPDHNERNHPFIKIHAFPPLSFGDLDIIHRPVWFRHSHLLGSSGFTSDPFDVRFLRVTAFRSVF
jgi:hypothetical protein